MSTIKDLYIFGTIASLCSLALTHQVHLEKLMVRVEYMPQDSEFYPNLKPLISLKTLDLLGHCDELQFFNKFLSKCPYLDELFCGRLSENNFEFIATHLKVKNLRLRLYGKLAPAPHKALLNSLTSLTIDCDIVSIFGFIQSCPMLQCLDVKNTIRSSDVEKYSVVFGPVIDENLRNTNLRHLKCTLPVVSLKSIFESLISDYDENRKLKLTLTVVSPGCQGYHRDPDSGYSRITIEDTLRFPSFRSSKIQELYEKEDKVRIVKAQKLAFKVQCRESSRKCFLRLQCISKTKIVSNLILFYLASSVFYMVVWSLTRDERLKLIRFHIMCNKT